MIKVCPHAINSTSYKINFRKSPDTINLAVEELKNLEFSNDDKNFIKRHGAKPPFKNGKEAYDFIKNSGIKIQFAKLPSNDIHAQWDINEKSININKIYKNNKNKAVILAISEAILHEAGHAKDNDGDSSIQEEINCLALNAMAHRTYEKKYPNIYNSAQENIVKNGVTMYSDIYFDKNPYRLIKRIQKSYSHLPAGDIKHPADYLALAIKYNNF